MTKAARILVRWGLVSENNRGPYLAGLQVNGLERTSTPLVQLDPAAGTALTASGRPYQLIGEADGEYRLMVARGVWGGVFDLVGSDMRALSPDEALRMIIERGNTAYNHTPKEKAAIAQRHGVPLEDEDDRPPSRPELIVPDPESGEDEISPYGSRNIFRDLGLPNPDVLLVKADLAVSIAAALNDLGLTSKQAVEATGLTEAQVVGIVGRGRTEGLSIERLDKALEALVAWDQRRKP